MRGLCCDVYWAVLCIDIESTAVLLNNRSSPAFKGKDNVTRSQVSNN